MRALSQVNDPWSQLFTGDYSQTHQLREFHARLRRHGEVARGRIGYVVTGYDATAQILNSVDFIPSTMQMGLPFGLGWVYDKIAETGPANPFEYPSMVVLDGPEHRRVRGRLAKEFTPNAARAMEATIRQIVDTCLASFDPEEPTNLVRDYCRYIPARVSAEVLGLDREMLDILTSLGDATVKMLEIGQTYREYKHVEASTAELDDWVARRVRLIRKGAVPPLGVIGRLALDDQPGDRLSNREIQATVNLLILAGFETTVNLIGSGIVLLLNNSSQRMKLQREPGLWDNAVEEIMRLDGPVVGTGRVNTKAVTVGATNLPAGTFVLLSGANHDPEIFPDPYAFDVARPNARSHIQFGGGRHLCMGAHLARMEGKLALKHLFDTYPDISLAAQPVRRSSVFIRGWESIPVKLAARTDEGYHLV